MAGWVSFFVLSIFLSGCPSRSTRVVSTVLPRMEKDDFHYNVIVSRRRTPKKLSTSSDRNTSKNLVTVPRVQPAWMPKLRERRWAWIVVHHSGTKRGNASLFGKYHRVNRQWDELGYHFVIGNGTDSGDGEVEVGSRWVQQKWGAHCKVFGHEEYNQVGIGICLVGNFSGGRPTTGQMRSLVELTKWLTWKYQIPRSHIIRHSDAKDTDCPGIGFPFHGFLKTVYALQR